jgi:hypothetical protein
MLNVADQRGQATPSQLALASLSSLIDESLMSYNVFRIQKHFV